MLMAEFDLDKEAWVIVYRSVPSIVTIPDPTYPGRKPVRFFMSKSDCERVIQELWQVHPEDCGALAALKVPLILGMRLVADADSFVVHSPNEVFNAYL